jgi:hypothetical protein
MSDERSPPGRRRAVGHVFLAVLCLTAFAHCARAQPVRPSPTAQAPESLAESDPATVLGRVVTGSGSGANGRRVLMKGHDPVVLVREGRFSFVNVPASYDVWVANQAKDTVAIYQGLTRRDPLLRFSVGYESTPDELPHRAGVRGILRADVPFPLGNAYLATVSYFADRASMTFQVGQYAESAGPRFGRKELRWEGGTTVSGTLAALVQHGSREQRWIEAFAGSKPLALTAGEEANAELTLVPVPVGRIAGSVDTNHMDLVREIYFGWELPAARGEIGIGNCKFRMTYDCPLPDLSVLGGGYCATIHVAFPFGEATGVVKKCGGKTGMTDFSIHVGPPPRFLERGKTSTLGKDASLSWTATGESVYVVELEPAARSPARPHLQVFTAEPRLRFPDLAVLGVKFPVGAAYKCQVSRLSPYSSLDELASARESSRSEGELQKIDSEPIEVTLVE